jgi:CBS domain-containing membrane protein
MTEHVYSLLEDDDLQAAQDLMWNHEIRHIPVVDEDQQVLGILTERDLSKVQYQAEAVLPVATKADLLSRYRVGDAMSEEVLTVEEDVDIRHAAQMMIDQKFGCLPVVSGQRLVGILTESDFVKLMAEGE